MSDLFPIERSAEISPCGKYRYSLTRTWEPAKGHVCWIMYNPSTADATTDDHTIRKCMGFAQRWGFGGIYVTNLFNWRATDADELLTVDYPISALELPISSLGLEGIGSRSPGTFRLLMAAWGVIDHPPFQCFAQRRLKKLREKWDVCCLKTTKDGWPMHPLYVPYSAKPIPYTLTPGESP